MRLLTRFSARALGSPPSSRSRLPPAPPRSTDPRGRARLRQRQHLAGQHDRRLQPTRRRHPHAGPRIAVRDRGRRNRVGDRITGRAADRAPWSLPARGRRGQRSDLGAQDPTERVAAPGARRSGRLRRIGAGQHRRPRPARLCRQRRRQRRQLHGLRAPPERPPAAAAGFDRVAAGRFAARRRAVQRRRLEPGGHAGGHVVDRQLPRHR